MAMTLESMLRALADADCEEAGKLDISKVPVVLRLPGIEKAVEIDVNWVHLTDSDSVPYTNHAIVISTSKDQEHLFAKLAKAESN